MTKVNTQSWLIFGYLRLACGPAVLSLFFSSFADESLYRP
jgi:hypothetical protein